MKAIEKIKHIFKLKDYPKLMITSNNEIVLFVSAKTGTVVNVSTNVEESLKRPFGYYSSCWAPECFEDYKGELILSNDNEIKDISKSKKDNKVIYYDVNCTNPRPLRDVKYLVSDGSTNYIATKHNGHWYEWNTDEALPNITKWSDIEL